MMTHHRLGEILDDIKWAHPEIQRTFHTVWMLVMALLVMYAITDKR